jgi:hypothetical protein
MIEARENILPVNHLLEPVLVIIDRGYMVICEYCQENVTPKMYLTWKGFLCSLGISYLIYIMIKIPQCPNCNFPMPRRSMLIAIPSQLMEMARMGVLQLIHFRDRVISASLRPYLNRKFNQFQHFGSTNTHHETTFSMMTNEVHNSIGLDGYGFGK